MTSKSCKKWKPWMGYVVYYVDEEFSDQIHIETSTIGGAPAWLANRVLVDNLRAGLCSWISKTDPEDAEEIPF
tara:strand:+ start:735 stop:953 length:219 start_codon:yes stop_codon:yes gene_type:complete